MTEYRFSDDQVAEALRRHLPSEAPADLRDRIVREAPAVQREARRRGPIAWLPALQPTTRRQLVLVATLALLALAIAAGTIVVGALNVTERSRELVVWNEERRLQDWPGPVRTEPADQPRIVHTPGPFADPPNDVAAASPKPVDIVAVSMRVGCWGPGGSNSACVGFDIAGDRQPIPMPLEEWTAYGIVLDSNGDGQPDVRFGVDNGKDASGNNRMWRTELATGTTDTFRFLEEPGVMDATYPNPLGDVEMGHIFAARDRQQEGVFRFYVWASAIVDGEIVGTDYAPDVGWLELPSPGVGEPTPTPAVGDAVRGWPTTVQNPPGLYSWDGSRCYGASCHVGFMHNGYGSGDVEIRINVVPGKPITDDGATAVTVAGHNGIYRRIDARREEWVVDIEGTTIAISLEARPGTSVTDLAEAHAIIDSMRTEPHDNDLGFRLVFTLTTDDWDSG